MKVTYCNLAEIIADVSGPGRKRSLFLYSAVTEDFSFGCPGEMVENVRILVNS